MRILWWLKNKVWHLLRYDIPWFFNNIWRFRKTLWRSRPWDWVGLYQAMLDSLVGMEEQQRVHGHSVNSEKYAKQIRVCIHLLERLIEDDYLIRDFDYSAWDGLPIRECLRIDPTSKYSECPPYRVSFKVKAGIQKADRALLFKILERHSQSFWD